MRQAQLRPVPKLTQGWVSLIDTSLSFPPSLRAGEEPVSCEDDDGQKANWGSRCGENAEGRDGSPSRGKQAFKHSGLLSRRARPSACLAFCGRWSDLNLQHGSRPVFMWPAARPLGWTAVVVRIVLARYVLCSGSPMTRANLNPIAPVHVVATSSCVSASWWGGKGLRGCKDFSRSTCV